MVMLNINGRNVEVDESFRSLTPEQQQSTVEEIARSMGIGTQPSGPSINIGGQSFSPDQWRSLPVEQRDSIRASINPNEGPNDPDNWRRGTLAPVERNEETGELRPAVPQIALDAWSAATLPGDVYTGLVDPMSEEGMRRAFDLSTMVVTGTVPGSMSRATMPDGQRVPDALVEALQRDAIPLGEVGQRVSSMGPRAAVADIGENVTQLAGGLASRPGEPQQIINQFMRNRSQTARTAIQSQVDEILGPSVSRGQANNIFTQLRQATSPLYNEAFDNANAVDTSGIASNLDSLATSRRGEAQSAVNRIRSMLNVTGTDQLDTDPRVLHAVRQEIDDMMYAPGAGNNLKATLGEIRQQINQELTRAVPGIGEADAAFRAIAAQRDAYDYGTTLLTGQGSAVDPRDLRAAIASGTDLQGVAQGPSAVPYWFGQGAREAIDRLIGTNAADRGGLRTAVRGDGSWNRDKLVELYGEERARQLMDIFDNEARFATTEGQTFGGSRTAMTTSARKSITTGEQGQRGPIAEAANFQFGNAANALGNALFGQHRQNALDERNLRLARALIGNGDWTVTPGRQPYSIPAPVFIGDQIYGGGTDALAEALMR